ncbi:MAG: hypothetical protein ACP5H2_06585 [Solirubrobacteraceae bacterium]
MSRVRFAGGTPAAAGGSVDVAQMTYSQRSRAERIAWSLVGVTLINWSIQLLAGTTYFAWVAVLVVISGAWGIVTVAASWLPIEQIAVLQRRAGWFAWATAAMVVVALGAWCYLQVRASPSYGTDEMAFDQYAAMLVQHGLNPYVHSMLPAFARFQVSPDGFTYTMAGTAVTQLSYPALAFLMYMPFLAFGWVTQMAVLVNVLAWVVSILLMFLLLPARTRAAGLVLASVAVYVSYAVGGVTDALYVPFLIGAAYRWDRFGRSRWSYLGPVLLGLAMAVKQTPWLIFLFVLLALFVKERSSTGTRQGLRLAGTYALIALAAFLAPNLPFIFMDLGAWWHGILVPVTAHLVPAGQGIIALSLFVKIGGGSLVAFTAATVTLALLVAVVYGGSFPLLAPLTFLLPAVVLFFAARSYGNYLAVLVPAALIGAFTITRPTPRFADTMTVHGSRVRHWLPRSWLWRTATAAATVLFAGSVAWALLDSAPMRLRVVAVRTTGQLATIEQVTVHVANTSGAALAPRFTMDEGGALTTFWLVSSGPSRLAAGRSANYMLRAPNFPAQPSLAGGFSVVALTQHPDALSASGPYEPATLHLALNPDAVNTVVPLGDPVLIHAQLLNTFDAPVHQADVAVYLGQIIYDQTGLEYSEARINNFPAGATPVAAYTNADGVATFTVVNVQSSSDPIYFEANLVSSRYFFPYGYSEILPIRFGR